MGLGGTCGRNPGGQRPDGTDLVAANEPGHRISPTLWGIFFEDINMSADGGIYPELVRNRSFEDGDTPEFWKFANTAGRAG